MKVIRSAKIEDIPFQLRYSGDTDTDPSVGEITKQPRIPDPEEGYEVENIESYDETRVSRESVDSIRESLEEVYRQEYEKKLELECKVATEEARNDGYQVGYEQGVEQGARDAQAGQKEITGRLKKLLRAAMESHVEAITGLEDVVVEIVYESVCKIVGEQLVSKERARAIVGEIASKYDEGQIISVRVSPEDYRILMDSDDDFIDSAYLKKIELRPDDRIEYGGCMLETHSGNLDARLEVQLKRRKDALLLARGRHTSLETE